MIRFATLLTRSRLTHATFASYAAQVGAPDAAGTARSLLCGPCPKRLASADTLLDRVAELTATPAFLLSACLAVTPDKAEVAALLLPPSPTLPSPTLPSPTLTETLTRLTDLDACLALARPLPPAARLILFRLATGSFRARLAPLPQTPQTPGTCLALLTLIDPAIPEATFALPQGNALIPLTRLKLSLPQTPQILAWARAHTTNRFGPLREVAPTQVFALAFDGTTPNPRRKCGLDLTAPRLLAWAQDTTVDQVPPLAALLASLP